MRKGMFRFLLSILMIAGLALSQTTLLYAVDKKMPKSPKAHTAKTHHAEKKQKHVEKKEQMGDEGFKPSQPTGTGSSPGSH